MTLKSLTAWTISYPSVAQNKCYTMGYIGYESVTLKSLTAWTTSYASVTQKKLYSIDYIGYESVTLKVSQH